MLTDINILLYAVSPASPHHPAARDWLSQALNGDLAVAFPWHSLLGFLRISTSSRGSGSPIDATAAWAFVDEWLTAPAARVVGPGDRHATILRGLMGRYQLRGDAVSDAHLAALAIEHDLTLVSFDRDFARFREVRWLNPASEAHSSLP